MKRTVRWLVPVERWELIGVVGLLWCLGAGGVGTAGDPLRQVLILDSYGRDLSPWNVVIPAFKRELAHQVPTTATVKFHEAALRTDVEKSPEAELAFANYLAAVYAMRAPDLVVPMGAAATQFWWRYREGLFPTTPVVIGGIERRVLEGLALGPNDTAVAIHFEPRQDIIRQVLPATTNISTVLGNSMLERFWIAEIQSAWGSLTNEVQLDWFNELPFTEICRRAAAMPPNSVLFYTLFFVDAAGLSFEHTSALDQLCAVANVPVFGVFEEHLGHGIVGGRLFSSEALGREAARIAARVLGGEPAGAIPPVVFSASQPTFDWRELSRWGIDERQLPPGSVVRFRQTSVWERHRWYILAALGIILLQALTILVLLVNRAGRRRAEGHLRESRRFMELATAAGELGLWVYNVGSDGIWVNPSMRWLFAWDENRPVTFEDLLGRVHPKDRSRAERLLGQSTRDGGTFGFKSRLALPDGSTRWIVAKGMASRDSQSGPSRVQGVVFDVTAQHVAESTAQRHRNELLHLTRVHVLEQLSSALAHELNQPLGAILCNTEAAELLLDIRPPPWAEIRRILADIRADNQRASHVIESIRALIKPHEMKLDPIFVHELIAECVALAGANAMERNVAIHCQVLPATSPVLGDRVHLQQVLLNLLVNGMDAMGDTPSDRRQLLLQAQPDGNGTVTVSIQDNGCGIPSDQLERVFDLFHSTKSTGLGVGLSISRTIIESHGGRIWAENHAHGGTTVRFTLPVAA